MSLNLFYCYCFDCMVNLTQKASKYDNNLLYQHLPLLFFLSLIYSNWSTLSCMKV